MTPEEYRASRPRLSAASFKRLKTSVNRWNRLSGIPLDSATTSALAAFRERALSEGLSPHSVEQTAVDVALLAGIDRGCPLDVPPPDPDVPTVARVEAIYRHCHVASWPVRTRSRGGIGCKWLNCSTTQWWQSWIVCAGRWGLRIGDLERLTVEDVHSKRFRAGKTGKIQPLPHRPCVMRHVRQLNVKSGRLFPGLGSRHQLRRELKAIASAAGVQYVSPHGFRRFAIQSWSIAHPEAGRIVHGCGIPRIMRHYVEPLRLLDKHAESLDVPLAWLTRKEAADAIRAEQELIRHYRRTSAEMRESLLRIARAV